MVGERSPLSRRELLAASAATGSVVALASCTGSSGPIVNPSLLRAEASPADLPLLDGLLQTEYQVAYAYAAVIPLLSGRDAATARQFFRHEFAHMTVLRKLISSADGRPSPQRSSYPLGHPRGRSELIGLLHRVEVRALGAYLDAIPRFSRGGVRTATAAIVANEGQHVALLRERLSLDPVPVALASGGE